MNKMCLGIPGRVVKVDGNIALVDFGGITREADASLEDVKPGDYVLVHVGVIISKLSLEEAQETIEMIKELIEQ